MQAREPPVFGSQAPNAGESLVCIAKCTRGHELQHIVNEFRQIHRHYDAHERGNLYADKDEIDLLEPVTGIC